MSSQQKAVFGIIGAGGIAQNQHLPNLTRAPHIKLKTICDLRKDVLQQIQQKYNIPEAANDYKKLLADPEIQGVVIATKSEMHPTIGIDALKAGKHIYVEKPLADTKAECKAVIAAQKESGKFAAVGFNRRFAPAYRKAKEIINRHGGPANIYYRIADELWARLKSKKNPKGYIPGTRLIHETCHVFDILRWFTDSEVISIYCVSSRPDDEIIAMQFASGCVATIMSSGFTTMDMPKERLEVIVNDKGGVIVEEFVELTTYGFNDCEPIYRFPGHSHPDREFTHKYLFEKEGVSVLYALRRMIWELRGRVNNIKEDDEFAEKSELEKYICMSKCPNWNYMVDKGWLQAVDHLAQCIITGKTPETATAEDGLKASILGHAAVKSRENKEVVFI